MIPKKNFESIDKLSRRFLRFLSHTFLYEFFVPRYQRIKFHLGFFFHKFTYTNTPIEDNRFLSNNNIPCLCLCVCVMRIISNLKNLNLFQLESFLIIFFFLLDCFFNSHFFGLLWWVIKNWLTTESTQLNNTNNINS